MRADRKSNNHFSYHNENPLGLVSSCDCVVRATAYASGKSWDDVYDGLCTVGSALKDVPNSKKVYEKYLQQIGFVKKKQPKKPNGSKYTMQEFAKLFCEEKTCIVSLSNHLTVAKDGKIIDTWDCGKYCVGNYWEME